VSNTQPEPKPLSAVSPSTYNRLRAWKRGKDCALCIARTSNKADKALLAPTAASKVGDIFHEVMEEAEPGMDRAAAEALWEEKSRKIEAPLASNWITSGLVPLSSTAGGFTLKRLMALRRACSPPHSAKACGQANSAPSFSAPIKEKLITSPDGLIRGKVDLVVQRTDGWHLIDYKSGAVAEEETDEGYQLKESYQLQLLIYAALLKEAKDIEIKTASLSTLDGKDHYLHMDLGKAAEVAAEARELLLEFNRLVEESKHAPQRLAVPLAANREQQVFGCSACAFRPQCEAYLSVEKQAGDGSFWPRDVVGVVVEMNAREERLLVTIEQTPNRGESRKTVNLSASYGRHPNLEGLQVGMRVGVFDLAACRTVLSDGPRTCVYRLV
jgi:hypothetical protein